MKSQDIWLEKLEGILEKSFAYQDLDNQYLAKEMGISERQLYRKVKIITRQSPNLFIRSHRLEKAMALIESKAFLSIS